MMNSQRQLLMSIMSVSAHAMSLVDIFDRLARGQVDVARGTSMMISHMLGMIGPIMSLTIAHQKLAIAGAASSIATSGWLAPVMAALIGTQIGITIGSMLKYFASREMGGKVPFTGLYLLHAGETVLPRNRTTNITVNVYSTDARTAGDSVVNALKRARVI